MKKRLAVAVAAYNLAETSRMIEISKEAKKYFDITFLTYGGKFEKLIDEEGFERIRLKPELTEEKLESLQHYLNGDKLKSTDYYNEKEIEARVAAEVEVLKKLKPVAVMAGWNLTVGISSKVAGIDYINVLHSTSITEYYEAGLQTVPDFIDYKFLNKIIPIEKRQAIFNKRVLEAADTVKSYNKVAEKYDIELFKSFVDLVEGDHVFLADIPEWVGLEKVRDNMHYIGPLPARLNVPVPNELNDLPTDKPIVYFAMGSSGQGELIGKIIEGFKGKPYYVISPVKSLVEKLKIEVPDNVIVTGFLPADKVNPMADISVLHGGQNTVMNACLSRTPIVGIGMHVEQQANLDACERKGFAKRLSKKCVNAEMVLDSIEKMLHDEAAKKSVEQFADQLEKWNGPKNAAELLNKLYQ